MIYYIFRSPYRLAIAGLVVLVAALWFAWYRTDQIMSVSPLLYVTLLIFINLILAYFSSSRIVDITRYLFWFSYLALILVAYNLYVLTRGII